MKPQEMKFLTQNSPINFLGPMDSLVLILHLEMLVEIGEVGN